MELNNNPTNKLDTLAHEAGAEEGAGGFMNPAKKRGRKPGQKNKPKEETTASVNPAPKDHNADPIMIAQQRIEANKQFITGGLEFLDDALYPLHETPAARLKKEQKELIVQNGAICMEQYLPDALNKHMPLILLSFGLGGYGFGIYNARKIKLAEMARRVQQQNDLKNDKKPPLGATNTVAGIPTEAVN